MNDVLSIHVAGTMVNSSLTLLDINGKTVATADFKVNGTVNMESYPTGVYILKVKTVNGIVTKSWS